MTITAQSVKDLREKTGAGMMDCKKALNETGGDAEAAIDWLRKKGLSAAAKKSGRVAAEGVVGVSFSGNKGVLIEVNAETDFVARNEHFQDFVGTLARLGLESSQDVDGLLNLDYPETGRTVSEQLTHNIATIGENMSLRRIAHLQVDKGVVFGYVHGAVTGPDAPQPMGRIGVIVALSSAGDETALSALAKQIAMHVAAANPRFLDIESITEDDKNRERQVLIDQAKAEGRPDHIIEKMVEGRMKKFYAEIALMEQIFVMDNETKISDLLANKAKELGTDITLTGFVRYELGEGIERKQEDFAAEVQAAMKG